MSLSIRFLLVTIFLTGAASAQTPPQEFEEFFRFLQNPDGTVQTIDCPETTNAPHCRDLEAYICSLPRGNERQTLETEMMARFAAAVPAGGNLLAAVQAMRDTLRNSEAEVRSRIPVTQEEIAGHFNSIKAGLIRTVGDQPGLSQEMRNEMRQKLATVELNDTDTFLNDVIPVLRQATPNATEEQIQQRAMRMVGRNCGISGMEASSFAWENKIVLCPGYLMNVMDMGARTKDEFLNGLNVLFAHEIAHPIGRYDYPAAYEQMGECYNEINNNPNYWQQKGDEISADYWSSRIFAERLATTGTTGIPAANAFATNFASLCEGNELQDMYPTRRDRINVVFGRNPVMRDVLGCEAPTQERPVCGLMGRQP